MPRATSMASHYARRLWWIPLGVLAAHFVFNRRMPVVDAAGDFLYLRIPEEFVRIAQAALLLVMARSVGRAIDEHPRAASAPDAMFPALSLSGAMVLVLWILVRDHDPWDWAVSETAFAVVGIGAGPLLVRYLGFEEWGDRLFQLLVISVMLGLLIVFDVERVYWASSRPFRCLYIAAFFAIGSTNFAWYFLGEGAEDTA